MNEVVKEFFDNIAVNYHHDDSKVIDELIDSLLLHEKSKILDLGCGKGIISEKLVNKTKGEVIALDISSKMIELAKEKVSNPKVRFINQDFYSFIGHHFDAIVCFDAYPHFLDVEGFVNKASELLKSDGILAIIHDIGRGELNKHHASHALKVSRLLKTPQEEVKPFLKYFKPIELFENENIYKIIVIKKGL